jgi:protein-disulfide isomerase
VAKNADGPRAPQGKGDKPPRGKSGSGAAKRPAKTSGGVTPSAGKTAASAKGRQSVAAARRTNPGSNRTQLIIGGVAVALIAAVVILGLVLNKKNNSVPEGSYGYSKSSTATVSTDGVITLANGSGVTIESYEDALCPICGEFERQFGQQMAKAVDEGRLTIQLHMLTFLDQSSASKDYSTRAYAALLAVAHDAGSTPGLAMKFHSMLFEEGTQPKEGGSSDLSNAQLGDLAVTAGAPASVKESIVAAKYLEEAKAGSATSSARLQAAIGKVGTPSILKDGAPVNINSVNWLSDLLG